MLSRRSFSALLAVGAASPGAALARTVNRHASRAKPATAMYSGVGAQLTRYEVDVAGKALTMRDAVTLPGGIQYAWPHPSHRFLYVTSSTGGPGLSGNDHHVMAFRVGPSGALTPHGVPLRLPARPIHNSVDIAGRYLLIAYNEPNGVSQPSAVSVHRIDGDGSIGEGVRQTARLDTGIYAHQIRATPANKSVVLVTRGNNPAGGRPEDPGALKVFGFDSGRLTDMASVRPGNGLGFGPRHLEFHPTKPWVFVSLERQNKLFVYRLLPEGGLSRDPIFTKDTVLDPTTHLSNAGPNHMHPSGRFVYLTNRAGWSSTPAPGQEMHDGRLVFARDLSSIAVFAIDQRTGEPRLIETTPAHGAHPRTFSIDPSGRMLIAGSLVPITIRAGAGVETIPAGLSVFDIGADGRLAFVRRYEIDTGKQTQWWSGLVTLAA